MKKLIKKNVKEGASRFLLLGTTGEYYSLSKEERRKIVKEITLDPDFSSLHFMVNIGEISTQKAIEDLIYYETLPIESYLITPPFFVLPEEEGIIEHFRRLDAASTRPLILYDVPKRLGYSISLETIKQISELSHVSGIKECSSDKQRKEKILKIPDFQMYSGNDEEIMEDYFLGASGAISSCANVWYDKIFSCLYYEDEASFSYYQRFWHQLQSKPNPVILKNILKQEHMNVGSVRLPLIDIPFFELECILKKFGYNPVIL